MSALKDEIFKEIIETSGNWAFGNKIIGPYFGSRDGFNKALENLFKLIDIKFDDFLYKTKNITEIKNALRSYLPIDAIHKKNFIALLIKATIIMEAAEKRDEHMQTLCKITGQKIISVPNYRESIYETCIKLLDISDFNEKVLKGNSSDMYALKRNVKMFIYSHTVKKHEDSYILTENSHNTTITFETPQKLIQHILLSVINENMDGWDKVKAEHHIEKLFNYYTDLSVYNKCIFLQHCFRKFIRKCVGPYLDIIEEPEITVIATNKGDKDSSLEMTYKIMTHSRQAIKGIIKLGDIPSMFKELNNYIEHNDMKIIRHFRKILQEIMVSITEFIKDFVKKHFSIYKNFLNITIVDNDNTSFAYDEDIMKEIIKEYHYRYFIVYEMNFDFFENKSF